MFVRRLYLKNFKALIIDELDRAVGTCYQNDFEECVIERCEEAFEDGFYYYKVDEIKLREACSKLS